jgi:hypothetical protein
LLSLLASKAAANIDKLLIQTIAQTAFFEKNPEALI